MDEAHLERVTQGLIGILKARREELALTTWQLAEAADLNQSAISLLERGKRNPTLDTLLRWADALNLDLGEALQRAQREAGKRARS